MATVTVDDLRDAESVVKRAEKRVATRRKALEQEETKLAQAKEGHAGIMEAYRQQHCGNGQG